LKATEGRGHSNLSPKGYCVLAVGAGGGNRGDHIYEVRISWAFQAEKIGRAARWGN